MWQLQAAPLVTLLIWCVFANGAPSSPSPEGNGDSLRGALEALDRRQRNLRMRPPGPAGRYRYPAMRARELDEPDDDDIEFLPLESGQPEEIGYGYQRGVPGSRHEPHVSPAQLEKMLLQYLDDNGESSNDEHWSSFREREEQANDDEQPPSIFRERQRQEKRSPTDDRYLQLLAALWDKYQREIEQQQDAEAESLEKRQDGYGGYDFYNTPMGWGDGHFNGYKKRNAENDPWYPAYEIVPRESSNKRFPITKRSSTPPHHKKVGTEVEADLAKIFDKKSNNTKNVSTTQEPATSTSEPLHPAMHKKAVDWSQYFGIDKRRKKSSPPTEQSSEEEDDEETERRLMEQYYHTLALATSVKRKRSGEEPASSGQEQQSPSSLEGMDQKLKAMEDLIVDEAVKFTGANQGLSDPARIQTVKEQVLSRLAAAYSLEKMRQALDEFRSSLGNSENENEAPKPNSMKRKFMPEPCEGMRILSKACKNMDYLLAESCSWHHACEVCSRDGDTDMCDAGFLRFARAECERTMDRSMCDRKIRHQLNIVRSILPNTAVACEPCVRRHVEVKRR